MTAAYVMGSRLRALGDVQSFFPEFEIIARDHRSAIGLAHADDPDLSLITARCLKANRQLTLVEDGLLRSIGDPSTGARPISLIRRDEALGDAQFETAPSLLEDARSLWTRKQCLRLTRTNEGAEIELRASAGRDTVLVVDRRPDEAFLGLDGPGASADYRAMLSAAREENPRATIVVLADHPHATLRDGEGAADVVLREPVNLAGLLAQVDRVYTRASLVGWEALLAGKPVVCFGSPFFAGRGLTDDRAGVERPAASLEQLFAFNYMVAARYVDPLTGKGCSLQTALHRLAAFKRHADRVRGCWAGLNLPPPKAATVRLFLEGPYSRFGRSEAGIQRLAVWASRANARARRALRDRRQSVSLIEDGFIRSAGLGSSFAAANSLVIDRGGIYYDPSSNSELEATLARGEFEEADLELARQVRVAAVRLRLSKYNLRPPHPPLAVPGDRRKILVPGQVENDASVIQGGAGLTRNSDLLKKVRAANPDAFIVYKEHPDVIVGNRPGRIDGEAARLADVVTGDIDIISCLEGCDEVHTLTSLTGFEALLRGKPVTTYGWPFYAGWGLTTDLGADRPPKRGASRTLDQLVAASLITYPLYLDPWTSLPCDALTYVERLAEMVSRTSSKPAGPLLRYLQALRATISTPRPVPY